MQLSIKRDFINNLIILSFISIVLSYIFNINTLFSVSISIIISVFCTYCKNIEENFCLIFFLFAFFFFTMGCEFSNIFSKEEIIRDVNNSANLHYYIVILLSLLGVILGYQVKLKRKSLFSNIIQYKERFSVQSAKKVSKRVFYLTYLPYILPVIERIIFLQSFTYYESYYLYKSNIPTVITFIGSVCPIAFALFLATFPSKREIKTPLLMYISYALLYIFTGKRFITVSSLIFVLVYFVIRNQTDKEQGEIWIKRKTIMSIIAFFPLFCIFLAAYSTIRTGASLSSDVGIIDLILVLMTNIADTDKVIKYGYIYKDMFPNEHIYSFGNIIDYFKYGYISKIFGVNNGSVSQTVEYALNGSNYAYTISYLHYPDLYLNGHGLGSCYIAELYQDAGYIGVLLGNLLYGFLLRNIFRISSSSPWKNFLVIYCFRNLLLMPRGSFDVIFRELIALSFIISLIIMYILVKREMFINKGRMK